MCPASKERGFLGATFQCSRSRSCSSNPYGQPPLIGPLFTQSSFLSFMARSALLISCTQASENIFHSCKQAHEEMPQTKEAQEGHWHAWEDEGEVSGSVFTQQKRCSPGRCHSSPAFQHHERVGSVGNRGSLFAACQSLIILTSDRARAD